MFIKKQSLRGSKLIANEAVKEGSKNGLPARFLTNFMYEASTEGKRGDKIGTFSM